MQRHWTINGRFLTQPLTGVQRYAREILAALETEIATERYANQLTLDLVMPPDTPWPAGLQNIGARRHGRRHGHAWEQIELPQAVENGLLSLGNAGPIAVTRQILCIHDVNSWDVPRSYSFAFRAAQRALLPVLGRRCSRIATVSHYSAEQLIARALCDRRQLTVIPNGHEHALRWPSAPADESGGVDRNTILMIGTPAPHKNLEMVLALADPLQAAGLKIAVVGAVDRKVYRSTAGSPGRNVNWLGRLSDGELSEALAGALCLAFPSLVEGFGLPPLEAMALGCPVVASDRASLPEICGNAVLYASPVDPQAWLDCFLRLKGDQMLRQQLITRGRERAGLYSWRHSARLYLELMMQVDEERAPAVPRHRSKTSPLKAFRSRTEAQAACSTKTRT